MGRNEELNHLIDALSGYSTLYEGRDDIKHRWLVQEMKLFCERCVRYRDNRLTDLELRDVLKLHIKIVEEDMGKQERTLNELSRSHDQLTKALRSLEQKDEVE